MSTKRLEIIFLFLCQLLFREVYAQDFDSLNASAWADKQIQLLSPKERIGQLFMVAAYSNRDSNHVKSIADLVRNYQIGGLIFFQGGPVRQALLCNYYQSLAEIPLLIAMDAEWGLSMRLDSTLRFPRQMALGAIEDDSLIYSFGREMANQCKRLGVHLNFAPVIDINNNPLNPVINDRSFGEDRYNVAGKGLMYMSGMQHGGILANAKHFPGHGNTDKDSHKTLPLVNQSKEEIDSVELYPFRELFKRNLASIMVAHLNVPALDSSERIASTLSKPIVTDLLKNKLGFKGLIFTDALNMKGVSAYFPPGVCELKALLAGNDILLFPENVPVAVEAIENAIFNGEISQEEIDSRVRKLLIAKYRAGLNNYKPIELTRLNSDLNNPNAVFISRKLSEKSLTLLKNHDNLIPFKNIYRQKIALLSIGDSVSNEFSETIHLYTKAESFYIPKNAKITDFEIMENRLHHYDIVIVEMHELNRSEIKNYGMTLQALSFLGKLDKKTNLVTVVFGNPYSLKNLDGLTGPVVMAYEDNEFSRSEAAQLLFGAIKAKGHLPITASPVFKCKDGFTTDETFRLEYTLPEETGITSAAMSHIDEIVRDAIAAGAMPGCQVLVAKDSKVIYNKSFGTYTYTDPQAVNNNSIYDLASLTKILATNLMIMKLYDQGKLDLHKKISSYVPRLKRSNKKNLLVIDLLTHQAGLEKFILFWKKSIESNGSSNYQQDSSAKFPIPVAKNMFLKKEYKDIIWKDILESALVKPGEYSYSDLDFYLLCELVEHHYKKSMQVLVDSFFYKPLGLQTMGYLPLKQFPLQRIVPTEQDNDFRKQLLQGYVHDPGAAMLGGVAGHAGLFSNANDVAIIMQMLLNKGEYGGQRFFKEETVKKFTEQQFPGNRRGLGFDKPEPDTTKGSPTCKSSPLSTFGHTGFTGTCTWADPDNNLLFIFLSNRINPSVQNKKLIDLNIRTKIQQTIYDALPLKTN